MDFRAPSRGERDVGDAMIITQAPIRISFLGGGTDFPQHFEQHGGAVLATAVDRFAYVTIQRFHYQFFDHRLRIAYRKTETHPRWTIRPSAPASRKSVSMKAQSFITWPIFRRERAWDPHRPSSLQCFR